MMLTAEAIRERLEEARRTGRPPPAGYVWVSDNGDIEPVKPPGASGRWRQEPTLAVLLRRCIDRHKTAADRR